MIPISGSRRSTASAPLPGSTQQNGLTLAKFGTPGFAADRDTLAAILDRPDNIPFVTRRGPYLYNIWKDATNPRGLWRRTTLDSFRTAQPGWEILLDVDALAAAENEDWVWHGASTLPGSHDLAILSLSRGGSDAAVLREFDIAAKAFVSGGFDLPEAKGGAAWLDRDTLLLSSAYGEGMATKSGYSRTVRLWRRGVGCRSGPGADRDDARKHGRCGRRSTAREATETVWFVDKPGFFDAILWLGDRTGPKVKLDLPTDIVAGDPSRLAGGEAPHGMDRSAARPMRPTRCSASRCRHSSPAIAISRCCSSRRERRALQHFFWSDGQLMLSILDELKPVFEVLTPSAGGWARSKLPGLPEIGVVNVWRFDMEEAEGNGDLLANAQDPITPATMSLIERGKAPAVLKRAPQHVQRRRAGRHAARSDLDRRRAHSLRAGRPARRDRQCARAPQRLRRLRHLAAALLQLRHRQALARARRHQRDGQHPRRRRVRHALARRRAPRQEAAVA